jgi:hypothetical protein
MIEKVGGENSYLVDGYAVREREREREQNKD